MITDPTSIVVPNPYFKLLVKDAFPDVNLEVVRCPILLEPEFSTNELVLQSVDSLVEQVALSSMTAPSKFPGAEDPSLALYIW